MEIEKLNIYIYKKQNTIMQSKPSDNNAEHKADYEIKNETPPTDEPLAQKIENCAKMQISKNELWGWTIMLFATLSLTTGVIFGVVGAIVGHGMLRIGKSPLVSVCIGNLIAIALFIITWGFLL